jgi:uncharacterized protein (DUF2267 family)
MSRSKPSGLQHSLETTRAWVSEFAGDLGRPGDERYALRVLRAFLHTLRDRLPVDGAAHLAAQLPELLRGIYFEGWRPSETPHRYHDVETLLDRVAREALLAGRTEAGFAVEAGTRLLTRHISTGEMDKIRAVLPHRVAAALTVDSAAGQPPTART